METRSDFVVFVDESGDHNLQSINPRYPVFVLAFCILPVESYLREVGTDFRRLKFELFGHDIIVLHEHDIRKRSGPFASLNPTSRERLLRGLTTIIEDATMTIVAVVIDKPRLLECAIGHLHPYNLALRYGLERVHQFLQMKGQGGLRTSVSKALRRRSARVAASGLDDRAPTESRRAPELPQEPNAGRECPTHLQRFWLDAERRSIASRSQTAHWNLQSFNQAPAVPAVRVALDRTRDPRLTACRRSRRRR